MASVQTDFTAARSIMIDTQIRPEDVTDIAVQSALGEIPRETFVPENYQHLSYSEAEIETQPGRWLWRPSLMAKALQAAQITPEYDVLDIAPGTGYSTAVLARLCARVIGLEEHKETAEAANACLEQIGTRNAHIAIGDLSQGLPDSGTFDLIWVNGAIAAVPEAWFAQLSLGGRIMVPLMIESGLPQIRIYVKSEHGIAWSKLMEATLPSLPGFEPLPKFCF